jgi:hypothetical protein
MGRLIAPLAVYVLLALLVTEPSLLRLASCVIGDPGGDVWKHLWGFWWVREAHVNGLPYPEWTNLLNYPRGGTLFFIDPVGAVSAAVLLWPLEPFVSADLSPLSYNLIVILNLAASAFAAYLLVWYLAKDHRAALASGVIYGFSPFIITRVVTGISEFHHGAYIPLFLLFLIKTVFEKSALNPVLAALFLALSFWATPYYGLCAILAGGPLLAYSVWRLRKRINPSALLAKSVLLLFVFLIPFNAFVSYFFRTFNAEDRLAGIPRADKFIKALANNIEVRKQIDLGAGRKASCTLVDFFLPGKDKVKILEHWDRLTLTCYPGFTALFLGGVAALLTKRRYVRLLALLALVFAALTLGPEPHLTHTKTLGFQSPLYTLLSWAVPFFRKSDSPEVFSVMVSLCLALLCAFSVRCLAGKIRALRRVLPACVFVFVTAELLAFSPAPFPVPLAPLDNMALFKEWGRDRNLFGVMNVPVVCGKTIRVPGEYFYHQTVHRKGMIAEINYADRTMENDYPLIRYLYIRQFNKIVGFSDFSEPSLDENTMRHTVENLKRDNYRYIVLHERLVPPDLLPEFQKRLEPVFGPPRFFPPGYRVYNVE